MGKRSVALAAAVAALSGWGLQAQAAGQAISGVGVAWAGQQIKVTWSEDTPVANTIKLSSGKELGTTTAADANELLVDRAVIGISNDPQETLSVVVSDPDGGSAASPVFDHFVPRQRMTMGLAGGEQAVWRLSPPFTDATPNDPLDVDTAPTYAVSLYEQASPSTCTRVLVSDSTSETGLIARRDKPYQIWAKATNEWGTDRGGSGDSVGNVFVKQAALTGPASAPYGTSAALRGTVGSLSVSAAPDGAQCMTWGINTSVGNATLQVESPFGGSWTDIKTSPVSPGQALPFTVPSDGAKNYRLSTDSTSKDGQVYYSNLSRMLQVRTTTRLLSAKFVKPVITYGTQPEAFLWVNPAGTQRAALQWKNPSGVWQGITYNQLTDGKGSVTFPFNRRGSFEFRWYVPATTSPDGLPVDAIYTGSFPLTVN